MGWRLHLSTQPIFSVQFVPGDTPQVAVWDSRHNVHFYNQQDATPSGTRKFAECQPPADLRDPFWAGFVTELCAPNGSLLPVVYLSGLTIFQSRDGHMRLYHFQSGGLVLEVDGRHIALDREQDGRFLIAGLDRTLGLSAALNEEGILYIYQQHVRVGAFDLGFSLNVDSRLNLLVPQATGSLVVSDGERLVITDSAGRVQHELTAHYTIGPVAVSPNGQLIVLGDIDDNLLRVYQKDLHQTHQKHAIDLVVEARQVQLLASLPGRKAALAALDVSNDGDVVFALGGVVCATHLAALDALPQPRPLL